MPPGQLPVALLVLCLKSGLVRGLIAWLLGGCYRSEMEEGDTTAWSLEVTGTPWLILLLGVHNDGNGTSFSLLLYVHRDRKGYQ